MNESLLNAVEVIIAHGCNNKGHFGGPNSVAAAIKKRWPKVEMAYKYAHASGALGPGSVNYVFRDGYEVNIIANVVTQHGYGTDKATRYLSYDALDKGLREVARKAIELDEKTVAIPRIGCGLANGRWSVIEAIILEIEEDTGVQFKVYAPEKV